MTKLNPIYSYFSYFYHLLLGKVAIDRNKIEVIAFKDKVFESFRHIRLKKNESANPSVFWVRFTLPPTISFEKNKRVSSLALPFFCGLPGFREKYWCVNKESNEYLGFYEWNDHKRAEAYSKSFAVKFMTSRAISGSITFDIYQDKRLREIITVAQQ